MTWDNDFSKEVNRPIGKAQGVMAECNVVWKSTDIDIGTKLKIFENITDMCLQYSS